MKKLFIAGALMMGMFSASAQNKIGYINTDELIASMPEAQKADAELKEYQAGLQAQFKDLSDDLNNKDSIFVVDSIKWTPTIREIKKDELIKLYQRVQNYQQESQEAYQQKANEKIGPIREKALNAIKAVAKENGYAYILNEDNLLVSPAEGDILPLVKTKLGIAATKPAAAKPATTPGKRP